MNETRPDEAPTTPPPPSSRPPLRRVRQGRLLGGVAAGLARHLHLDVSIMRILLVIGAVVTSGLVVLAYVAGWLLIPVEDEDAERPDAPGGGGERRDARFWLGVGLLIVGALWLLGGPWGSLWLTPTAGELLWPLVLIGFGLALWRASDAGDVASRRPTDGPPEPPPPPHATGSAPATGQAGLAAQQDTRPLESRVTTEPMASWPTAPPAPAVQATPRRRSPLTAMTVGLAFVVVGVLWLLRVLGGAPITALHMAAAALLVLGLGLLVGSVAGRGRWLILLGGLLLPVVVAAQLLEPFGVGRSLPPAGQLVSTPATMAELESSYQLGTGRLLLDLSELELDEAASTGIQLGAGEVVVRLPEDVTAEVSARAGAGEVEIDRRTAGGIGIQRTQRIDHGEGSEPLELDVQVGLGAVTIDSDATTPATPRS